jgi:hypothetical protein
MAGSTGDFSLGMFLSPFLHFPLLPTKTQPNRFNTRLIKKQILTTLSPSTKDDTIGRWIRRKMAISGITVGANTDFHFASACLRAFWLVERWVISSRVRMVEEERGVRMGEEIGGNVGVGVRLVYEKGLSGEGVVEL